MLPAIASTRVSARALLGHDNYTTLQSMKKIVWLLMGLGFNLSAGAEIYKYVDANGRVTYTNTPVKGATKLDIEPPARSGPGSMPTRKRTPTPADFPRVDRAEQQQRDSQRRLILQDELATERRALEMARQQLAENERTSGQAKNPASAPDEKQSQLRSEVTTHARNVEMLEKELKTVK